MTREAKRDASADAAAREREEATTGMEPLDATNEQVGYADNGAPLMRCRDPRVRKLQKTGQDETAPASDPERLKAFAAGVSGARLAINEGSHEERSAAKAGNSDIRTQRGAQ